MTSGDREMILTALPDAAGDAAPIPFTRRMGPPDDLWAEFEVQLKSVGGQLLPPSALRFLIESRDGPFWADADAERFLTPKADRARDVWHAEVGICLGELAIAETGTVMISSGPGRMRLTSLAPPVSIVIVREERIVARPEDAFNLLPKETSVFVTGTSRTADIEGIMVRGVHGPRELYVVRT